MFETVWGVLGDVFYLLVVYLLLLRNFSDGGSLVSKWLRLLIVIFWVEFFFLS